MTTDTPAPRLLRMADVMERTALSRSYIYARIKRGEFPKPLSLGHKCSRWTSDEIDAWVKSQMR